jgi:multiple sugar transport system substrate-binding protein
MFALTVVGCGGGDKKEPAKDMKKPFAGQTIRVLLANHPWAEAIKPLLAEFEKETGIIVKAESYSEKNLSDKLTVELATGSSTIDVYMSRPLQEAMLFAKNKWAADLKPFINDPGKTPADWDWNDNKKSAIAAVTVNGVIVSSPIVDEWSTLYYRKDLFEKAGLKPPTTMEELEAAAKKLNDPANGVAGFVSRGNRGAAVTQFSPFLYSFGADFIKDGKAAFDTPAAMEAFKFYGRILKNYGPPGVTNMSWEQAIVVFSSGKAAMWNDAAVFAGQVTDKTKSQVADQVGFAVFPAGPAGAKPYDAVAWGLGISSQSKNKDASWEFIKWANSKAMMKKMLAAGIPVTRISAWADKEATSKYPPGFAEVAQKSGAIAVPYDRPVMTAVGEARDAIGTIIVKAIETGGAEDLTPVIKEQAKIVNDLLSKE